MEDLTVPKLALQIGLPEILPEVPVSQRLLIQKGVSPNMSKDPQVHVCRRRSLRKGEKRSKGRVPSRTPPNRFAGFV